MGIRVSRRPWLQDFPLFPTGQNPTPLRLDGTRDGYPLPAAPATPPRPRLLPTRAVFFRRTPAIFRLRRLLKLASPFYPSIRIY